MNRVGGRADEVAEQMLADIVGGRYLPGARLPTEPELCAEMNVSRATLREAMKSLQQRGVISVQQGRGSFVEADERWSPFDPVLFAARTAGASGPDAQWLEKLVEVRRMVEVGVAALAAERRSDADIAAMEGHLTAMRASHDVGDIVAFAEADLAFHDAILRAAGNEFIAALFDPISRLIHKGRLVTSRTSERQAHALRAHREIFRAVAAGNPNRASKAMQRHLNNTFVFVATQSDAPGGTEATGP